MSALTTHNLPILDQPAPGIIAGPALHEITFKEVVGMLPVAAMQPGTGPILGLISLRGKTVPVIDLRMDTMGRWPLPIEGQLCLLLAETRQRATVLCAALVDSEAAAYELLLSTTH